jgi:hypothetical protein
MESCVDISDGRLRLAFLPFMSLAAHNPLSAGGVGAPGRERQEGVVSRLVQKCLETDRSMPDYW